MSSLKRLPNPQMYTIGWITALDKELTAAEAVLDEEHQKPENFRKHLKDTNNYIWGRIGDHNIVIASLAAGKYGTVSAATTAWSMISSLPHLRFGLMVGIGAGIPRLADNIDIRLGDVVVSQPTGASPGVVQYDVGKLESDGHFKRVGSLAPPPEVLLKGLATLKAKRRLGGPRARGILDDMLQRHPLLAEAEPDDAAFVHQGVQNDRLFEASSVHVQNPDLQSAVSSAGTVPRDVNTLYFQLALAWVWSFFWLVFASVRPPATSNITRTIPPSDATLKELGQTRACEHCDSAKEIGRRQRRSTDPVVHYGLIASGNSVVKDGVSRDDIVRRLGDKCICFEMEAAGLMDNFPCLVIRGICDYADTHKNDRWQNYSAATAAALAKELLEVVDCDDVEGASRADEIMQLCEGVSQIQSTTKYIQQDLHFQEVMKWLSPPDPSTNDNKALQQRHKGTGQWFLDSQEYSKWKTTKSSSLWLYGIPGCGKTILSSIIVKDLRSTEPYTKSFIYFYFDFTDTSKQSLEKAIRSLIAQLYCNGQNVQAPLNALYSSCKSPSRQPSIDMLSTTFEAMVQQIGEVWIVLDALDECQTRTGPRNEGSLHWIERVLHSPQLNIHLLITSRPEHDITSALERFVDDQIMLQSNLVTEDIRAYVHGTVRNYEGFRRWRSHKSIQDEIETHLMEKANGMFRWVSCQLEALEKCPDPLSLRQTLQSLPRTLDETYARVLSRIPPEFEQNAIRILQFLAFSERPLRVEEAVDVVAVDTEKRPRFDAKNRMPEPDEISVYCSSLVAIVTRGEGGDNGVKELQLAHFSVKEYLISNRLQQDISRTFMEPRARASITEVCLAYLLELDHSLSTVRVRQSYPLAQYAARYWMSHAIQAETSRVRDLIREFCLDDNSPQMSYQLYKPDKPWSEELISSQTDETVVLYYVACGGIVSAVEDLLKNGANVNAKGGYYGNTLQAASWGGHQEIVEMLLKNRANINAEEGYYSNALQAASWGGHQEIVQMLLKNGANVNAEEGYYSNALQAASWGGHQEIVQMLLKNSANVNAQGGKYGDALQAASLGGHQEIVQMLLKNGANVNAQGGYYSNALYAASERGDQEIVQMLLKNGANINAKGGEYGNALHAASVRGHQEIVQMLLKNGPIVNAQDGYYGNALYAASERGHQEIVQMLLKNEAEVDSKDTSGRTPLSWAAEYGHEAVVKMLLDTGKVDIDSKDSSGRTPLSWAAEYGHKAVVKMLLDTGKVDIDSKDTSSRTPLSWAAEDGHEAVVKMLLDTAKVDIDSKDTSGRTPLSWAAVYGHEAVVKMLLDTGKVDVDSKDTSSRTPLSWAAVYGHEAVVKMILDTGKVDIDSKDTSSRTPLSWAAEDGHEVVVKMLLDTGRADINSSDNTGRTPLSWAIMKGHSEVVLLLANAHDADINIRDHDGFSPFMRAVWRSNKEVVDILLQMRRLSYYECMDGLCFQAFWFMLPHELDQFMVDITYDSGDDFFGLKRLFCDSCIL